MNLTTFSRLASKFYISGAAIYLRSAPGRGKTSTIIDAVPRIGRALDKNLGLVTINGPLLTPADTVGYLVPTTIDGRVESSYTSPFWWRTVEGKRLEEYDGGVIFIDEMDKADTDVKKVIGEMALSGRCGPHKLPDGWVVWMAGNRQGDRSGSTKELDHLINRRFEIDVTDDIAGWEVWALKNNVHPSVVVFALANAQVVFPDKTPEKQGPFCTPRSLVATSRLLVTLGDNGDIPTDTDAIEVAAAGIGHAAAAQLFATLRLESELPSIESILGNPGKAKLPSKPDAQMLCCYKLASLSDAQNLDPIITYVERLPADFAVTYAKAVITRLPMLLAAPPMLAWCKRNSSLMAVISLLKN